uniref:Uncharacterized protein n=1 Tax=Lepeophtheirus salmonis TaxID=72036 RepID=A0A0K2TLM1_LEPSM
MDRALHFTLGWNLGSCLFDYNQIQKLLCSWKRIQTYGLLQKTFRLLSVSLKHCCLSNLHTFKRIFFVTLHCNRDLYY